MHASAVRLSPARSADRSLPLESWSRTRQAGIADLRPEAVAQRRLVESVHTSSHLIAQAKRNADLFGTTSQTTYQTDGLISQAADPGEQKAVAQNPNAEAVRCVPGTSNSSPNRNGLPESIRAGVESLSGFSLDDVKVHYNSFCPAQLNAAAYASGSDIYIASGQEQHLPHEAWHIVQQLQGRVKPTDRTENGTWINNDKQLEEEADVMGQKASVSVSTSQKGVDRSEGHPVGDRINPSVVGIVQMFKFKNDELKPHFYKHGSGSEKNVYYSEREYEMEARSIILNTHTYRNKIGKNTYYFEASTSQIVISKGSDIKTMYTAEGGVHRFDEVLDGAREWEKAKKNMKQSGNYRSKNHNYNKNYNDKDDNYHYVKKQ